MIDNKATLLIRKVIMATIQEQETSEHKEVLMKRLNSPDELYIYLVKVGSREQSLWSDYFAEILNKVSAKFENPVTEAGKAAKTILMNTKSLILKFKTTELPTSLKFVLDGDEVIDLDDELSHPDDILVYQL